MSGGEWQTKFNVSPGPGLWSLVLGPSGPDLGPGPELDNWLKILFILCIEVYRYRETMHIGHKVKLSSHHWQSVFSLERDVVWRDDTVLSEMSRVWLRPGDAHCDIVTAQWCPALSLHVRSWHQHSHSKGRAREQEREIIFYPSIKYF